MKTMNPELFFDLTAFSHRDLFFNCRQVWEALKGISPYLHHNLTPNISEVGRLGEPLPRTVVIWKDRLWEDGFEVLGGDVTKGTFRLRIAGEETSEAAIIFAGSVLWDDQIQLGRGCVVEPGALIKGPTVIGSQTEIRQGAYIRGKCIIGDRCVVGHTTEMKSSVMLNGAKAGHFAYIGDSILGNQSNLGAGTKLANLKIKAGAVRVKIRGEYQDTGLRKLGAVVGDNVEIGCNAVTNPGALLGKGCMVFPLTSVPAGYYEPNSVVQ